MLFPETASLENQQASMCKVFFLFVKGTIFFQLSVAHVKTNEAVNKI